MSCAFAGYNVYSLGASGAIFGVTGATVGILVLNWQAIDQNERYKPMKGMLMCLVVCLILFSALGLLGSSAGGGGDANVDNFAHGGGFLGGIFVSMIVARCLRDDTPYEK